MVNWIYESISRVGQHYKEMTAIALLLTFIKISLPIFLRWLNKRLERSEHRKRVKLWTDIGLSEEEAEEIIRRFEDDVKREMKRISFLSRIRNILRKKTQ
ncbi:hypothetical protein [Citrobacter farmeri]|uniref:hypothetical protein n=1 Tax=Citrobacter farmeri TaxID=67824 RepID=UPI00339CD3FF